jgi:hypothetical protein
VCCGAVGVVYAIVHGVLGRPNATANLLAEGIIPTLISLARKVSPRELVSTAGCSRRPYGLVLFAMTELIKAAQVAGVDLTGQLLANGYIDLLIEALSAAEEVGAEGLNGTVVVWGILLLFLRLNGEAIGQIEDKLRTVTSSLRYLIEHDVGFSRDWGFSSGSLGMVVAANLFGRDE